MTGKYSLRFILAVVACGAAWSAYADSGTFSVASGFDSTSGNYGSSTNTSILTIPVIGKYETDSALFKLTVPYLQVTSATGVVPGVGIGPLKKAGSVQTTTHAGLGDVVAAASYYAIEGDEYGPGVDLTAKIKLPTADKNAGLGTGEIDYALQVDVYQSFDKLSVNGAVGRKFLGSSADLPLNDIFYGSIGAGYQLSDKAGAGINLDAAQASSSAGYNVLELSVYAYRKLDKHKKLQGYLLKGLANGSPDVGLGMLLTFAF